MPLTQSGSEEALKENIATEIAHGKPPAQAVAIAHSVQRANDDMPPSLVLSDIQEQTEKWSNP
jgi:hypothetical protein